MGKAKVKTRKSKAAGEVGLLLTAIALGLALAWAIGQVAGFIQPNMVRF